MDITSHTATSVTLDLSKDEALVLFELLARHGDDDDLSIQHQAEQRVLWDMHAAFERALSEPFRPDYREVLAQARGRVADQ